MNKTNLIPSVTAGSIALLLYVLTMYRGVGYVDSGELVAAACTAGVPHPTGYPTIMLVGYGWSHLLGMFDVRPVFALNLLNAIFAALGVALLALLFDYLFEIIGKRESERTVSEGLRSWYAAVCALMIGVTGIWWMQAQSFEVYALHQCFMSAVSLLFLRYVRQEAERDPGASLSFTRRGIAFALVLGLAFTNHLTTVLLAPAFLFYYFRTLGFNRRAWVRLLYLVPFFIIGLLPYVWLPVAASGMPWVNWGEPDTLGRFVAHVSGADYRMRLFASGSGWNIFTEQIRYLSATLPKQMGYAALIPAIVGIMVLFKRNRILFSGSLLMFVSGAVYATNYNAYDVDSYFLVSILALGIWFVAGMVWVHERFGRTIALAAVAICIACAAGINFGDCNRSGDNEVEYMTADVLKGLPDSAVVITAQWNYWSAASLYMQTVEHLRPDVVVLNRNLLDDGWYWNLIRRHHPELTAPIEPYIRALELADHRAAEGRAQPSVLQQQFGNLIHAFIETTSEHRPVCLTTDIESAFDGEFHRVPYGYVFLLQKEDRYIPQDAGVFRTRSSGKFPSGFDPYFIKLCEIRFVAVSNRALYERDYGNMDLARYYAGKALKIMPAFRDEDIPVMPLDLERIIRFTVRSCKGTGGELQPLTPAESVP